MSSVVSGMQNCGSMISGFTSPGVSASSAVGCTPGTWINGWWYPYDWPQSYWPNPVSTYYHLAPVIDYDLLADKIADRIKGTKDRSKEDIRKEINKLLSELEKAK